MVSQYDDAHAELFDCAVQIRIESFDFILICRNTKRALAPGENESLDGVNLAGRDRVEETCLGGRLDPLECAARWHKADEWV
jgi:hypothetical protein